LINRITRHGGAAAALLAALALSLAACASGPRPFDPRALPHKRAAAYGDVARALARPVPERIGPAPELFLDYLRRMDRNPAYAAYEPTRAELELFADYYGLLPPKLARAMGQKVVGIYFISNLAGGGLSEYVYDEAGSLLVVMAFNPAILKTSLSDWIAYRDSSPYAEDGKGIELRSTCSGSFMGLAHTLTHEAAHVYDYAELVTPFVEPNLAPPATTAAGKDFTRGVWEGYAKPIPAYAIPGRDMVAPYGLGPKLPLSAALGHYRALARTPFTSLYGSGSWAEDFAEAAAWEWLGKKLGLRYQVTLTEGGRETLRFSPGATPRPEASRAAVEAALE
jgi:hypothetical protein